MPLKVIPNCDYWQQVLGHANMKKRTGEFTLLILFQKDTWGARRSEEGAKGAQGAFAHDVSRETFTSLPGCKRSKCSFATTESPTKKTLKLQYVDSLKHTHKATSTSGACDSH
jgi:hypothetical protein